MNATPTSGGLDAGSFLLGLLAGVLLGALAPRMLGRMKVVWEKTASYIMLAVLIGLIIALILVSQRCGPACDLFGATASATSSAAQPPSLVVMTATAVPDPNGCVITGGNGLSCRTLP
ncbi:MAG: hypothetical protein K1X39_00865 [Thermoflexales bacterium]|nr:hypothetical protein [Thermoflexales bacterium]